MSSRHRIRTVYCKELVDILRDRRTLIAMIVVPIVLYPLLMLGSIQAISYQSQSLGHEKLVFGVLSDNQAGMLWTLLAQDVEALEREQPADIAPTDDTKIDSISADSAEIRIFDSVEQMEWEVSNRTIHVGVVFGVDSLAEIEAYATQVQVQIHADLEEIRSARAASRLREMLSRTADRVRIARLDREALPSTFNQPYEVAITDLSAPPSILGQILPLILVLMTITGAIYPAIDLTAGERERGTLESLMVCPVPVIDLIVGKFLVVTTVAIMGAALNLASVSATVYFGGFDEVIARTGGGIPIWTMLFILLCLIPFAVFMSAIMIAVCSYARTFKEAQNYVTPVILAVMIPGGIAALPATRLEGIMLVVPVGNMVLLARDCLLGAAIPWGNIAMVLLSTSLYATAAVAVAANIFGKESVVFADAASLRTLFNRSLIQPSTAPPISMVLLVVALLFPTWFFVQASLSSELGDAAATLYGTGWLMPLLFIAVPGFVLIYWKVNLRSALSIRLPAARYLIAAVLIGLSAWVPAREINVLQFHLVGVPEVFIQSAELLTESITALPVVTAFLLIAVIPALCEELLFRGFLLSGVRSSLTKWPAIMVTAVLFGVFHFILFRFAVTAGLGMVLAYLCWQSRSVLPAILAHFLHNSVGVLQIIGSPLTRYLGIPQESAEGDAITWEHLPMNVIVIGLIVFAIGIAFARRPAELHGRMSVSEPQP